MQQASKHRTYVGEPKHKAEKKAHDGEIHETHKDTPTHIYYSKYILHTYGLNTLGQRDILVQGNRDSAAGVLFFSSKTFHSFTDRHKTRWRMIYLGYLAFVTPRHDTKYAINKNLLRSVYLTVSVDEMTTQTHTPSLALSVLVAVK